MRRREGTVASLIKDFDSKKHVFDAMYVSCKRLLEDLLQVEGIRVLSISGRVKERASLTEKLNRPAKNYGKLSDVTDVVGLRVVTFFEDDVDQVAELIKREFNLVPEHCVDKRMSLEPDRFGYRSLHYVCGLSTTRQGLVENGSFREELFEIQIRSVLQHAWAEIEHDLGYKGEVTIPNEIKRQLSRVSGLLEIADRDFREVRDRSRAYRERVAQEIKSNEISQIELNAVSYKEFVDNSPAVRELDSFISDKLGFTTVSDHNEITSVEMLNDIGVDTIEKLQQVLDENLKLLKRYADRIFGRSDGSEERFIATGISLFHLPQLLALRQGGVPRLAKMYVEHLVAGAGSAYESAQDTERTLLDIDSSEAEDHI